MKGFKNEAAFSHYFLKNQTFFQFIQRIETGLTGRGVPDLFCVNHYGSVWVELKNNQYCSINNSRWCIPWRAGQQAWAKTLYNATYGKEYVFTVQACKDGYLVIPMRKYFKDLIVTDCDVYKCKNIRELSSVFIDAILER